MSHVENRRHYKYFDLVMAGFVAVILCANLIGPAKVCRLGPLEFGAGNLFFPLSYLFGDILTEIYGYARSRKVIWAGFGAMIFASFMCFVIVEIPSALSDDYQVALQPALELVFGNTWRIVIASIIGFWAGEFANSYVLARMKLFTRGRYLWTRTIGSTIVGQAVDTVVFYPLAFYGIFSDSVLLHVMGMNYLIKVAVEVLMTPVTYRVVGFLKRVEQEDYFDTHTDFSPFTLRD